MAGRDGEGTSSGYGYGYDRTAGYGHYQGEIEEEEEVGVGGGGAREEEMDSKAVYDQFMALNRDLQLGPPTEDELALASLPPTTFRTGGYGRPREVPKGFVPLLVGKAGEQEECRYIVPAHYLKNRVFVDLLDRSVHTYLDCFVPSTKHRFFRRSHGHPPKDPSIQRGELKLDCDIEWFERTISRIGDPRCVLKANPNPNSGPDLENERNSGYIQQSIMDIFRRKDETPDTDYLITNQHLAKDGRLARDGRLAKALKKPKVVKPKVASPARVPQQEPTKRRNPHYQLYPGQLNKGKVLLSDIIEEEENEIEEEEEAQEEESYDEYGLMSSSSYQENLPLLVGPDYVPFGVPKRYLAHPLFKELLIKCAWEMPSDPEVLALPSIDALAFEQFISLVEADDLAQAIEFITFDEKHGRTRNHRNLRQRLNNLRKDLIPKLFHRKNTSDTASTSTTKTNKKPPPNPAIPKFVRVLVGEHEKKRFDVPTSYLKEPIFREIVQITSSLEDYQQRGILALSCDVEAFEQLLELLDRNKKKEKTLTFSQH